MYDGDIATSRLAAWNDSLWMDHSVLRMAWGNVHEVIPGRVWRGNHPTPARLRRLTRKLGLVTLVNLRGQRKCGSEALSRATADELGLAHVDMPFESRGAPHRERILRFHGIWRTLATPTLLHCKSGADRAGLASGLVLMFEGGSSADALRQLSWRYGHWASARTGVLDAFFHHYAAVAEGRVPFLDWVRDDYDEQGLRERFHANGLASFITDRVLRRE